MYKIQYILIANFLRYNCFNYSSRLPHCAQFSYMRYGQHRFSTGDANLEATKAMQGTAKLPSNGRL